MLTNDILKQPTPQAKEAIIKRIDMLRRKQKLATTFIAAFTIKMESSKLEGYLVALNDFRGLNKKDLEKGVKIHADCLSKDPFSINNEFSKAWYIGQLNALLVHEKFYIEDMN